MYTLKINNYLFCRNLQSSPFAQNVLELRPATQLVRLRPWSHVMDVAKVFIQAAEFTVRNLSDTSRTRAGPVTNANLALCAMSHPVRAIKVKICW